MDSDDGRISIAACNAILDRALGTSAIAVDHCGAVSYDMTQLTDAELEAIIASEIPERTH